MREIDVDEAKKHLSTLLDEVVGGETIVITCRGKPVARLVPAPGTDEVAAVIARMQAARRERRSMSTAEVLEARDEGRR